MILFLLARILAGYPWLQAQENAESDNRFALTGAATRRQSS